MSFLLGLIIGVSIYFWRQYRINLQLKEILSSLPQFESIKSLSLISLVRRSINLLNRQYQAAQIELGINQDLLEKVPIGYLRIDEENQLIYCNQQARDILQIERWQPQKIRLFLELVRSYELDQLIQQTRKMQQNLLIEWQFYPSNHLLINAVNDSQNNQSNNSVFLKAYSCPLAQGQVGIFIENQQALVELSRSHDRSFTDLNHELRTPLTSMSLLAQALLLRTKNQEKEWVEQMYEEINRLIDLVQNWLDISQLHEDPHQYLHYQSLDLKQLIVSAWQSVEVLAKQKDIKLSYSGPEIIHIEADMNRLTQVFINLFDNGIKHSYEQGTIKLDLRLVNSVYDYIEIDIIDSGTGFNSSDLPHIFERLYRGDKSRVRESREGSGLGLAIVKEIIEAHHGSIIAQNHPETIGAWFKIKLPTKSISNEQSTLQ